MPVSIFAYLQIFLNFTDYQHLLVEIDLDQGYYQI